MEWGRKRLGEHLERFYGRTPEQRKHQDERKKECKERFKPVLEKSQKDCYELLQKYDKDIIDKWNNEIDNLLVFVSFPTMLGWLAL